MLKWAGIGGTRRASAATCMIEVGTSAPRSGGKLDLQVFNGYAT